MTIMPETQGDDGDSGGGLPETVERTRRSTSALGISATTFASAMSKAFADAVAGGKKFDDVLKSLTLKLSDIALKQAFKPVVKGILGGLGDLLGGLLGGGSTDSGGRAVVAKFGAIKPFAAGGVIGAPTYFPLSSGGLGLAGEAGPEAIVPLTRGADGRLGVSMNGTGAPANVTVQIATPDPGSFRRSEAYITGQIARAVARGQRGF